MCLTPFKIKSVNPIAPRLQYVPCGKCKDCRISQKNAWSMRLGLELEVARKNGWLIGFCTLTYNDGNLPHFPVEALDKNCFGYFSKDGSLPACFDKQQVRDFIVNLRRDLFDIYHTKGLKYMVCSEYGSHTQRPHYHCIFAWQPPLETFDEQDNPVVVGCSGTDFFALIKKYWTFGFVFPKDFNGGIDFHGYRHHPFLVSGDARFAAAYAGKYCCKDLDFVNSLKGYKFNRKSKEFRNGDCFHIQSKSLGLSYLADKSDTELSDLLFRGVGFQGDDKLHQLPLYLRNKIYFSPKYIVERKVFDGIRLIKDQPLLDNCDSFLEFLGFRVEYKRLVRREATAFFKAYSREIFDRKVDFWTSVFDGFGSSDFLRSRGVGDIDFDLDKVISYFHSLRSGISSRYIASYYVSRFGLPRQYQYDIEDYDLWQMRYTLDHVPSVLAGSSKLITDTEIRTMDEICDFALSVLGMVYSEESDLERHVNALRDKFKHME